MTAEQIKSNIRKVIQSFTKGNIIMAVSSVQTCQITKL